MDSALEEKFAKHRWFHSIDFGTFASSGRFRPGSPQNITLYGFMDLIAGVDLKGASVLDVGAVDGLASFGMKALGASEVHSTDSVDQQTYRQSRDVLGLNDIHYHPHTQIKDFHEVFKPGQFDLILCAGVIYHMFNPVSAFLECRKIIKDNGLLIMETPYYRAEERAAVFINSETQMVDETFTYSVPTKAAVLGLMRLVGIDVLAVRTITGPDRITVLGRATDVENVRDRTKILERMHKHDFCDFEFRVKDHLPPPSSSAITYSGPGGDVDIDYRTFVSKFPYHPDRSKQAVGSTMWHTPAGNR